jgi:signal transduction histidine kinase
VTTDLRAARRESVGSRLDALLDSCCRTAVQDVLFAAALAVLGILEIWVPLPTAAGQGSPVSSTVLVLVVCGLLAVRRRWPVTTCVLIVCSWTAVSTAEPARTLWWGLFVPVIVAVFTVGRYQPSWWGFWVVPLTAAAGVYLDQRVLDLGGPVVLVVDAAVLTAAYAMGRMQYLLGSRAASAEDRADDAERSSSARAAAAVADERARIARELHDVIAHSVTVMIVQAGAAEQVVDDPERTRLALGTIRTTGKEALAEMRRLVGLLRDPGRTAAIQPQPGTALLPALIDQTRTGHLQVDARIEGQPAALRPGLDLAVYRIVQEALTNTQRHSSATTVSVVVQYRPDQLEITVRDNGRGTHTVIPGHGLVGMRERAVLYGGRLETTTSPGSGFTVHVVLPVEAAAA